jgi:hypothetical protein
LNPYEFFVWAFLKDIVYRSNKHAIQGFKQEISVAVVDMTRETEGEIMDSFQRWP